jgi:hypothetical protein
MVCKKGRLSNKTIPCSPPVNMDRKSHKCRTNQYASMESMRRLQEKVVIKWKHTFHYVRWKFVAMSEVPSNGIVGASQKVSPRYAFVVRLCH